MEHRSFGFRAWSGRAAGMTRAHQHTDVELNVLEAGDAHYVLAGRLVTLPVGRLCVFWGGAPHRLVHASADTTMGWVTAPLPWVLGWALPRPFVQALLTARMLVESGEAEPAGQAIRRWSADLRSGDASLKRSAELEIEARLRRLAAAAATLRSRTDIPQAGLNHVEAMSRLIAQRYQSALSVDDVATAAGLNPSYAMVLFRRIMGQSIVQHITRQRVAHAQRLLATTKLPVLEVALRSGFGSTSRFHEAFRQVAGQTPRQFRRSLTGRVRQGGS